MYYKTYSLQSIGSVKLPKFINLSNAEKNEILARVSSTTNISPLLLEKDFWVTWLLNNIFQMDFAKDIVFKGGTSLSKCYGLIQRFSEDIDITIDKNIFSKGINDRDLSGKKFKALLENNDQQAVNFIKTHFVAELSARVKSIIPEIDSWALIAEENEPKNLRFYYPTAVNVADNVYVKQSVLIEVGVRGDVFPCEEKLVQSYAEADFSNILIFDHVPIKTLSPVRTFWEKITLIHAENHRPESKKIGDRLSRHYYDIYKLIEAGIDKKALARLDLLNDVIKNKSLYFKSSWANYGGALAGTLKIVPNTGLLSRLETDYSSMRSMIFGEIPKFETIISAIREFEIEFNSNPHHFP